MIGADMQQAFLDRRVTSVEVARFGRGYECIIRRSRPPYVVRGHGETPEAAVSAARQELAAGG